MIIVTKKETKEVKSEDKQLIPNNKIVLPLLSAILSFCGVFCLPQMMHINGDALGFTNSIFAVAVFIFFWYFIHKALLFLYLLEQEKQQKYNQREIKRQWKITYLFAMGFTIAMIFGTSLEEKENVVFTSISMWISIVVLSIIIAILLKFLWEKCDMAAQKLQKSKERVKDDITDVEKRGKRNILIIRKWEMIPNIKQFLLMAGILLLCWLPVLLAVYPGFFVYDAQGEYLQVVTGRFSTHHPLIHVLLLGGIIQLVVKITGSYNLGIACYTLLQMIILSGVFSYGIVLMRKKGVSFLIRFCSILYFGFFPVVVMFTLCSTKDGLFTGLLLILFFKLEEICRHTESFFASKIKQATFIISAVGMMLLRHNGVYAYLIFIPILLWFFIKNKKQSVVSIIIILAITMISYGVIDRGLSFVLNASDGENQEILTVPIQQLARTYTTDYANMKEEDLNTLFEILPSEILPNYNPKLSDGVKFYFNNENYKNNTIKYVKLWLKLGISHPYTYLNAWFMTSYGFWYPDTVIDVYRGNPTFTYVYQDSSYFGYEVEQPGTRESKIPWLNEWYRKLSLEITQQKIPVVSMLFSPGFLFWVMMFTMGYLWYQRRYQELVPYLLPLLIWLTVTLGPTYLVRYVLFLWFLLPSMLQSLLNLKRIKIIKKKVL